MLNKAILIIIITAVSLSGQSAGNSGLSFLKIGTGARNIALGDNGNTLAQDVTALFYNPSGLYGTSGTEVMLMHNEWIEGIRSELFGVKFLALGLPVGIGINYTGINDIEIRTNPGEPLGKFTAHYFMASLSTATDITDELSVGITGKFLNEDIFTDYASGYGFDIGAKYLTPVNNLVASAVVRNIGSMSELRNEATRLPSEMRIGAAYLYSLENYDMSLLVATELNKYFDVDDYHINTGAEITYKKMLSLRAGYQAFYESKGFTAGLGINYGNFSFDYALTPFYYNLGTGHSFSVNFKFN